MASVVTLKEDFNNPIIPAAWQSSQAGGATIAVSGGRLELSMPSSGTSSTESSLITNTTYDLTSNAAMLEVVTVPNSATNANAELRLYIDADNWVRFVYEAGTIYAQRRVGGSNTTITSSTYNAINHRWLRIRESSGTTYWDVSKDGLAWVPFTSQSNPIAVTALTVRIAAYCYQNETSPGNFYVDNFNNPPTPLAPSIVTNRPTRRTQTKTVVEILNRSLEKVAEIRNLYPITQQGMVLRYSKELSDYGRCKFRVATDDPIFDLLGDILQPHVYNVRIKRGPVTVWQGVIINNPARNKNYVEVDAAEYEYYLEKMLIRRDTAAPAGTDTSNDAWKHYRTFQSGTMASAVLSIVTQAKEDFGANHPLSAATVTSGEIENPDYPAGFKDANGADLTGGWNFSSHVNLRFDYHTVLYVLKAFGIYTLSDFTIDDTLTFKFKKFLGNKNTGVTFEYGTFGNIVDYNIPRLGTRMVNDVWGIAADDDGTILHVNQRDESSIQTYGRLMGQDAYGDVKTQNFLKTRVNEGLQFSRTPESAPTNILLNEKAYPLGVYDIGDIVTVKVKDNVIDYSQPRRIVGITVTVHNTGRELVVIQTNRPRDKDMGGV